MSGLFRFPAPAFSVLCRFKTRDSQRSNSANNNIQIRCRTTSLPSHPAPPAMLAVSRDSQCRSIHIDIYLSVSLFPLLANSRQNSCHSILPFIGRAKTYVTDREIACQDLLFDIRKWQSPNRSDAFAHQIAQFPRASCKVPVASQTLYRAIRFFIRDRGNQRIRLTNRCQYQG